MHFSGMQKEPAAATVMTVEFGTSQWMASTIIQVRSKILEDWSLFVQFFEQIYTKITAYHVNYDIPKTLSQILALPEDDKLNIMNWNRIRIAELVEKKISKYCPMSL